jgi:hypothetical protein
MDFNKTTKRTKTRATILSATLIAAAAAVLMFPSLSPQAQAQLETDISTTITDSLASGFEAGAGEAEEGGNTDLADEFSGVADALRGEDRPPCPTCP